MNPTSIHRRKHRLSTRITRALATHKRTLAIAGTVIAVGLGGGLYYHAVSNTPEAYMARAVEAEQRGDLAAASIELKNALQSDPNNAEARNSLGRIHFANGDFAAAEKELKKARELGFWDDELDLMLARTLLSLNQPKQLIEEVQPIEGGAPGSNAAIHALRARAHLLLGDSATAEGEITTAQVLSPDHPETLVSRAYLALTQKNMGEALALTDQALAKADSRADLWIMKGDLLRATSRNQDAAQAYAKALALDPANGPARLASAQLHLENNDLDKAEADLKLLLKHAPNSLFGRHLAAFIDFRRGRHAEANAKLQDILRAAPTFLPAQLLAGATSLALGNREAAKSHLNKVLDAAPDHALARKLMAATLTELGEVDQAKNLLSNFEGASNDPLLNTLRGELALRQGDFAQARKQFEAMGEAAPQTAKYFTDLAASRMGSGDEAGAIAALTKAAELDTTSARPDALLVLTHLREKRFAEANKIIDSLQKERPNDPLVHNLRGTVLIAQDDKTRARASLAKALQIKPDYFPAASNLALLDMMDKDIKLARSRFDQLLKHAPAESRAWMALAALDARENNEAGYLKNLEQARKANAKNAESHMLLARYWLGKQDGGKALAAAREGQNATGLADFHELVGLAQLLQKDQASALSTFTRWVEVSPNNPLAHFRLAQVQITGKNNEAALKSLDKALALRADFVDATMSKALLLGQTGRAADGIRIARNLQANAPKSPAGFITEADILFADKKFIEAGKLYAKAGQMSGQGQLIARAHHAHVKGGQSTEGEQLLENWLKAHPNDALVRHQLALGHLNAKRLKESADQYRVLVRANPKDLVAYNNLAWLLGELKTPDAVATAEQAYKLHPNSPEIQDTLGWILVKTGQTGRGLELIRKALAKAPDSAEIHWHLAYGLHLSGDKPRARQELRQLLQRGLAFPQKPEAEELLRNLGG